MSKPALRALTIAVPILVVAGLIWLWIALCPYFWTMVAWEFNKSWFWLLTGIIVVVLVGAAAAVGGPWLATPVGLLLIGGWIFYIGFIHSYQQDADYAASTQQVDNALPTFTQRAPFEVATAQVGSNLGDVNGDALGSAYLPATGHFGTLVEARGLFTGYEGALEQTMPLTGRGTGHFCQADASGAILNGWFGHNLGRRISELDRGLNWSTDDAYGYCDPTTNHPMVVVPLKSQVGFFTVTERPAGVAVYDTTTQALDIRTDSRGLPGPSYPLSLAETQRESLPALGSFSDYVFGRAGFELAAGEVNSSGGGEFVLGTGGQGEQYVTPLTGRGSSQSVAAISTITAGAGAGNLAPLVVHKLTAPPWLSIAAFEKRIQSDYQTLPNWQLMQVMELAPTDNGHWVATLGNGQNVNYRVTGTGDLTGTTCLQRIDGDALVDVQCGNNTNVGGNGPGVALAPAGSSNVTAGGQTSGTDPLAGYSNDQLIGEVQRRLAQTGGPR